MASFAIARKEFRMHALFAIAFTLMLAAAHAAPALQHIGHIIKPLGCSCM